MGPVERHRLRQEAKRAEEANHRLRQQMEWDRQRNPLFTYLGKTHRVEQLPNKLFAKVPRTR